MGVKLLPGNQLVGVEGQEFLPLAVQTGELVLQGAAFRIPGLFQYGPFQLLPEYFRRLLPVGKQSQKAAVQGVQKGVLVQGDRIAALICTLAVPSAADPAGVGAPVGSLDPPEGPAAVLAADQGRKQMAAVFTTVLPVKGQIPGAADLPGGLEVLGGDDLQLRTVRNQPVLPWTRRSFTGEEVPDFFLAVDDFSGVYGVLQNAAHGVLTPRPALFGTQPLTVQQSRNLPRAAAVLYVQTVNLSDNSRFPLVDGQMEVIAGGLVVAVHQIGYPAPLGVDAFAEFDALGHIGGFLLCQRAEQGQDKFAVTHGVHICGEKQRLDAQCFQTADALQQVYRVPGQTGDVLDDQYGKKTPLRVLHHLQKGFAAPDLRAGNAFVRVEACQGLSGPGGVGGEKRFLRFQTVQLVGLVRGYPAVSGNVHSSAPCASSPRRARASGSAA